MIALVCVVIEVKCLVWLLTMLTSTLPMIKTVKPMLAKKRDEILKFVSPRWTVKNEIRIEVSSPDNI